MEIVDAAEFISAGLETAREQGFVLEFHRETAAEHIDFRAKTKFDNAPRTVFVRCYGPQKTLTPTDIVNVDCAAKRIGAHMVLVVGNGREAIREAKIEGIGVLLYDTLSNLKTDFWTDLFKPAMQVYGFSFRSEQLKQDIAIPEEPALLAYMMRELRIVGEAIDTTPEKLVEENEHGYASTATSVPKTVSLQLPAHTFLIIQTRRSGHRLLHFRSSTDLCRCRTSLTNKT